jgi:hypothetical protein
MIIRKNVKTAVVADHPEAQAKSHVLVEYFDHYKEVLQFSKIYELNKYEGKAFEVDGSDSDLGNGKVYQVKLYIQDSPSNTDPKNAIFVTWLRFNMQPFDVDFQEIHNREMLNNPDFKGGGSGGTVDWSDVENKPTEFPPSAHTHTLSDLLQSGATNGQVPSYNEGLGIWEPVDIAGGGVNPTNGLGTFSGGIGLGGTITEELTVINGSGTESLVFDSLDAFVLQGSATLFTQTDDAIINGTNVVALNAGNQGGLGSYSQFTPVGIGLEWQDPTAPPTKRIGLLMQSGTGAVLSSTTTPNNTGSRYGNEIRLQEEGNGRLQLGNGLGVFSTSTSPSGGSPTFVSLSLYAQPDVFSEFDDNVNSVGLKYRNDYSGNWTADPKYDNILVTKKWVSDNFSGGGGTQDFQSVVDEGNVVGGSIFVSGDGAGAGAFVNVDNETDNKLLIGYSVSTNGATIEVDQNQEIKLNAQGGSQVGTIKVSPAGISLEVDSESRPIEIPTLPQDDSVTQIIGRDDSGVLTWVEKSSIGGGTSQALVTAISPINQATFGTLVCFPIIPVSGQSFSKIRLTLNITNKAGSTNPQALDVYYSTNDSQDTTGDTLLKSVPIDIDSQTSGVPFEADLEESGTLPNGTYYFKANNVGSDFEYKDLTIQVFE